MKLPKDTEDWHQKLISAFDDRARYAVARGKKDQHNWRNALEALRKSQDPIYIQKGGENKGVVKGIPKAIGMGAVRDRLIAIVKGNEAWDDPKYQDLAEINLTATTFFRNRKYKDSCYGILASMFSQTKGDPTILNKAQIVHSLRKYHDGAPDYDYRTGQQGAWKAIDQLVAKNLVSREKVNLMWRYQLTNEGYRYCYLIFNEKFHPSRGAYQLVEPGNCTVSPEGVVTRRNGQPAALANAAAGGGNPRNVAAHDVFGGLHAGGFGGLNDQEDGDVGGGEFGEDDWGEAHDWGATHHPTLSVVKKPRLDYNHNFNFDHTRTEQKPFNLHNVSQTSATLPELTQKELRDKRIQRLDPEFERRYAVVQKAMIDMDLSYEEAELIVRAEEVIAAEKRRAEHRAQQEALLQEKRALEEAKRLSTLSSAAPNRSGTGNSESQDLEEALFQSELSALEEEERRRELDISLVGEKRSLDEDYETFVDFDYDPVCFDWEDGDDSDCEDRAVNKSFSQDSVTPRKRHSNSYPSNSSSSAAVDVAAAEAKFPVEQQLSDSQEEACLEVALAMSLENNSAHLLQPDTASSPTKPSRDKMLVSPLRLSQSGKHPSQSSHNYRSLVGLEELEAEEEVKEVPVSKRSAAWTPTALKSPKPTTSTTGVVTATITGSKSTRNFVMDLTDEMAARPAHKTLGSSSSSCRSGNSGDNIGGMAALQSPYRRGGLSLNERLNQSIASLPSSPQPVRTAQQPLFLSPPTTANISSAHNNANASSASASSSSKPLFAARYSAASNVVDLCLSDDDDEAETQPLPVPSEDEAG